ncbi:MAG: ureidoglycolate lyase [Acidimicrobiia bacterium]
MEHRRLKAEPVTAEGFAPFGEVPVEDGDPDDAVELVFTRADPHFNFIVHTYDEVEHTSEGTALCDHLNRHDTATQTLCPLTGDAVLVVAPPAVDFSDPAHLDTVRAFVLHPHEAVNLALGTWHWGPFPVAPGEVRIANMQGRGYSTDNAVADIARELGAVVEVVGT